MFIPITTLRPFGPFILDYELSTFGTKISYDTFFLFLSTMVRLGERERADLLSTTL